MIRSVSVLGAGTMGAQIAAHFANAGVPALLLDLTAEVAAQGLQRARALKPDPFFTPDARHLVRVGGFDADLARIAESDWIIEAVVERLDVKARAAPERSTPRGAPAPIVSSNTSGIPIAALAEGRSDDFRRHWLGTHFFNPPRYLHLLEIIPTAETQSDVVEAVTYFSDHRLGKGVVVAKDSPGFIGNHIGLHAMMHILAKVAAGEYTIEEVDAITGPALGRPKSATFRTLDLAGLDILRPRGRRPARASRRLPRARDVGASRVRQADARTRHDRREERTGILQAREERRRRVGDPHAGSGNARVPVPAVAEARGARRHGLDHGYP